MLLADRPGQVWLIYLVLIAEAGFSQFFAPARKALIPVLVGRGPRLGEANSFAALISGTVQLIGGPLGGALYVAMGFAPVVAIDAVGYLASAILIERDQPRSRTRGTLPRRKQPPAEIRRRVAGRCRPRPVNSRATGPVHRGRGVSSATRH